MYLPLKFTFMEETLIFLKLCFKWIEKCIISQHLASIEHPPKANSHTFLMTVFLRNPKFRNLCAKARSQKSLSASVSVKGTERSVGYWYCGVKHSAESHSKIFNPAVCKTFWMRIKLLILYVYMHNRASIASTGGLDSWK